MRQLGWRMRVWWWARQDAMHGVPDAAARVPGAREQLVLAAARETVAVLRGAYGKN